MTGKEITCPRDGSPCVAGQGHAHPIQEGRSPCISQYNNELDDQVILGMIDASNSREPKPAEVVR